MTIDPARPWMPLVYGDEDRHRLAAIKAVGQGTARPEQQRDALNFIVERLCRFHDLSYLPDERGGERDTAFAEGRRYVGAALLKALTLPMEMLAGPAPAAQEKVTNARPAKSTGRSRA